MQIQIPPYINSDALIPFLGLMDIELQSGEDVHLEFSALRRITPGGLAAIAACTVGWRKRQHDVYFDGMDRCQILGYLQRMDLLRVCGIDMHENFTRHEARGRFVPLHVIDHRVDEMGHDMAACLAPGGEEYEHRLSDLYALAWYVLTETANNVRQHSKGIGYVSAQVNGAEGLVRLALADNGRGILKSFQDAGLAWSQGINDVCAIQKALEPQVSSRGGPTNEGVGLTLVSRLIQQAQGWLLIVSGSGVVQIRAGKGPFTSTLPGGKRFEGTLVGMTFRQQAVEDYANMLQRAKIDSGLLQKAPKGITFRR